MFTIALHAGAGSVSRDSTSPEKEEQYLAGLDDALLAGYGILEKGGSSLLAVAAAVESLENNPLFNAGRGAAFAANGTHEMDAAIMCGKTFNAGAVAGVRNVQNPIRLAKAVMEHSESVLLAAAGAEQFAREQGILFQPDSYFFSDDRYRQLQEARSRQHANAGKGTVGAVAIDSAGNLASATSTGGLTNKMFGRVGDSPLIGGGTYANNRTCAVSCTGDGEGFIRLVSAYDVSCLMEYRGLSLDEAARIVIMDKLTSLGGEGGLAAVDSQGSVAHVFNGESMLRAWKNNKGAGKTAIWR